MTSEERPTPPGDDGDEAADVAPEREARDGHGQEARDGRDSDAGRGESALTRLARTRMAAARRRIRRGVVTGTSDLLPRRRHLRQDVVAGIPGGIASVPDGMASAVLAGINPVHGLYASFVGRITGGLTSSTRLMVITTTSAAALAAGSALAGYADDDRSAAMVLLTLLAGALMIVAALLRLSRYIRFVSYSVMLGFLTGIAANIILGQIPVLLGVDAAGNISLVKAWNSIAHLDQADLASALVGVTALVLLVVAGMTRLSVLGAVIALVVPTTVVAIAGLSTVPLVADGGAMPQGLPVPRLPDLSLFSYDLLGGAAAVAAILLIQGAGVAEAVPTRGGPRSVARKDFRAQGLANLAAGLFGGQPVGGSVGQTAVNVSAGAASRWAAIWSGLWLGLILLALSGIVGKVAMPTLAAVLIHAGFGAIQPREVIGATRAGRIPLVAMVATFVAVLLLPVAQAVGVGVLASLVLQLNQEALDLKVVRLEHDRDGHLVETTPPSTTFPGDVVVLQAYGSLFYAGARTLQRHLPHPDPGPSPEPGGETVEERRRAAASATTTPGPVVILRLRGRGTLGATFLKVIGDYARSLEDADGTLYLSGVDPRLAATWARDGTARELAGVHIREATPRLGESTTAALREARGARHRASGESPVIHHVTPTGPAS